MHKVFAITFVAALLLTAGGFAQEAAPTLDEAFDYLPTYKFGESRAPLTVIRDAVAEAANEDEDQIAALEKRLVDVLESDCSDDAARFICRQLAVYGGAASVPALVSLLGQPKLAEAALDALERNPAEEAAEALRSVASQRSGALQLAAIEALGARRDTGAVEILTGMAEAGSGSVRAAALMALAEVAVGNAQADAARKAVLQAAETAGPGDGPAIDALLYLAPVLPDEQALAAYQMLYNEAYPEHVRAAALGGLLKVQPDLAEERILAAFDDPVMRPAAVSFLREMEDTELPARFAARLGDMQSETQVLVLPALADAGVTIPIATLDELLNSGNEAVQTAALAAVPATADAGTVPLLLDLAVNAGVHVKRAARDALAALPDPAVDGVLVDAIDCEAPERGEQALRALGSRGATDTVADILAVVDSGCEALAGSAWDTLRNLAGHEKVDALMARLLDIEVEEARTKAERAIAAAANRNPDEAARGARVLAHVEDAADGPARLSIIRIMGAIPNEQSLTFLREHIAAEDREVRLTALDALAGWPGTAPVPQLLDAAESGPGPGTKDAALDAAITLLRRHADQAPAVRKVWFERAAELADTERTKKNLLAGLSELGHPAALTIIEDIAQEAPAIEQEVLRAQLNVAKTLYAVRPGEVRPLIEEFQASDDDAVRKEAAALLEQMNALGGYLTAWRVAGPYQEEGKRGAAMLDIAFAPEKSGADAGVVWRLMPMGLEPGRPYVLDFAARYGAIEAVVYARTTVNSPDARDAELLLGSNDGMKVWLNGEEVYTFPSGRVLTPDEDKVNVSLEEGANTLMLKVTNHGGAWGATARLTALDGQEMKDVTCTVHLE
ncbi:MAG: HEAT repeat domain-containing protein [Candidatus Hydrogenedentota bacterium]